MVITLTDSFNGEYSTSPYKFCHLWNDKDPDVDIEEEEEEDFEVISESSQSGITSKSGETGIEGPSNGPPPRRPPPPNLDLVEGDDTAEFWIKKIYLTINGI